MWPQSKTAASFIGVTLVITIVRSLHEHPSTCSFPEVPDLSMASDLLSALKAGSSCTTPFSPSLDPLSISKSSVHPFLLAPFRCRRFVAFHFVTGTLCRQPFRGGDTVTWHFIAGKLRRQPFRRGDTSSPAVSSREHFVDGRRG